MSEHHHRYHSAPATDEYRANFDRIFRQGYVYVTYPLASSEESREATKEALTRSMAQSSGDYSEAARKQRDALVQSARASAEAEKTCARVMNQAFGSDAERRKHLDIGFALPGTDDENSARVTGPGRGVFGQDGT